MLLKKSLILFLGGASLIASATENGVKKGSKVVKNPFEFSFQQNKKGAGYIPSTTQSVPRGIKVVAIVDMGGKKGVMAALRVANDKSTFYVKQGDVIRVDKDKTHAKGTKSHSADEVVYLEVVSLNKSEVTIAPKQRPDAKVILR